ncbi:hypothetical protein F2Q68_00042374 [Brassica cretica]|uniref:ADP,ATP carrier protein n=1 Tax=Brassica cretica TaxID=69181 RepID=A0A8S9MNP8_BRACR|nr:hypothetical protein F2Q68_00042374 [Brassica cretica]
MEEAKQIEVGETSSSTPSRKVITLEPKLVIKKGISTLGFVFRLFAVFGTIGSALAMGTTQESVVSLTQLTRMMNQGEKGVYRSSYDCLVKTVRFEGVRALWKGFLPTWGRLGPWQFVFWVSYEKFRQLAGLSSF